MAQTAGASSLKVLHFDDSSIRSLVHEGNFLFSSRDICSVLGYSNTSQTIKAHCFPEYQLSLEDIAKDPMDMKTISMAEIENETSLEHSYRLREKWLTEPGLYQLLGRSKQPAAEPFQRWIYEEVMPSLRKDGSYNTQTRNQQVQLINETDLHYKIVEFIRKRYPDVPLIAGLGELQDSSEKRIDAWRKGYTKGQPDLMLPIRSGRKNGLALELKSPGWQAEASEHQKAFLRKLEEQGWQIKISNCYEDLLFEVRDYLDKASKKRKR
jgi:prophage antirepressor-like protein